MTPPEIAQLKELLDWLVQHHWNAFEPDNQSRLYLEIVKARDESLPALLTALESSQRRVEELDKARPTVYHNETDHGEVDDQRRNCEEY